MIVKYTHSFEKSIEKLNNKSAIDRLESLLSSL